MPNIPSAKVLIVATSGFEEWELFGPRQILQQRGATVMLASLARDPIQATVHDDPGKTIRPDLTIDEVRAEQFDALILPGGVRNPDQLRMHANVIALVRALLIRTNRSVRSVMAPGCWWKPICSRPYGDELAFDPNRSRNAGAEHCGRAGGHRRKSRYEPQSGRRRSIHRRADRIDRAGRRRGRKSYQAANSCLTE